jgi:DnaJ-domain-containing protein 1
MARLCCYVRHIFCNFWGIFIFQLLEHTGTGLAFCDWGVRRAALRGRGGPLFSMPALYDILGVTQSAEPEQIKRSYRILVKRFHPDLFPSGSDAQVNAGERLRQIIAAYRTLSDPQKRLDYDKKHATSRNSSFDPQPEHCDKCGEPTLYWQIGREAARCDQCGGALR